MAQFRGVLQSNRGAVSRLGQKTDGLECTVNGWGCGVCVRAWYDEERQIDVFDIYSTGGSNHKRANSYIGCVVNGEFTPVSDESE